MRPFLLLLGLLLSASTSACVDDASVTVKYVDGYQPGRTSISVLGVFRDGRMSVDTWTPIAPLLSTALGTEGADVCEPAFGAQLQREHEDVFSSIDDDVRNNGITEDLLTKLATRAQGDVILTISVHGSVQTGSDSTAQGARGAAPPPAMRGQGAGAGAGGRGRGGAGRRDLPPRSSVPKPLELSATLFSIKLHKQIARLTMSYTGTSTEEALRRFATEVAALAPGSTCRGWSWPRDLPPGVAPLLDGP
jgi:hypothetical protein